MSAFDEFNAAAFDDAVFTIGTSNFSVSNVSYTGGVLNEYTASKQMEVGGLVGEYDATLMVRSTKFSNIASPVERTLEGQVVVIEGRSFRIEQVISDSLTVTLLLANKNKTS